MKQNTQYNNRTHSTHAFIARHENPSFKDFIRERKKSMTKQDKTINFIQELAKRDIEKRGLNLSYMIRKSNEYVNSDGNLAKELIDDYIKDFSFVLLMFHTDRQISLNDYFELVPKECDATDRHYLLCDVVHSIIKTLDDITSEKAFTSMNNKTLEKYLKGMFKELAKIKAFRELKLNNIDMCSVMHTAYNVAKFASMFNHALNKESLNIDVNLNVIKPQLNVIKPQT